MIQQRLQQWILHPESLNEDTLFELREVLQRFPYFQTARLLYLKNLFLLKDASFKEELRKSVLYVADLSQLFYYIEGEHFVIEKHKYAPSVEDTPQSVDRTLALIDRFLSDSSGGNDTPELTVQPEVSVDYMSVLLQQESPQETETAVPLKGQDLIDSFIESSASLSAGELHIAVAGEEEQVPVGDEVLEEVAAGMQECTGEEEEKALDAAETAASESTELGTADSEEEDYFTETLAKIYVKQQRYDKALEIIKKLNLKYPKKKCLLCRPNQVFGEIDY